MHITSASPIARPEAQKNLAKNLASPLVKVILGPRRAGKSSLALKSLEKSRFAYANLEDEDLLSSLSNNDELIDALDVVYPRSKYFLFDEIQNLDHWESFLNRQHRRGKNIIVTGSNSRLLSRELASALTGRHAEIELLSFSLKEFIAAKCPDEKPTEKIYRSLFDSWYRNGGFPEVVTGKADASSYLRSLFDAVLLRDVSGRHKIRNITAIRSLSQLLMNSIGGRFSSRSLERALQQISFATIQKYISYMNEAYLFFELQAFSFKSRQRIASERKIYTIDNGTITACSQALLGGEATLLENVVFVELLRRGYRPNLSLFYLQTKAGYEVDFFLPEFPKAGTLIQVCFSTANPSTLKRELRSLHAAAREFRASRAYILTYNDEASISQDGLKVEILPVWKWCVGWEI